ncbi:hypothetical protein [Bacillus cereus group sp. MYBK104-1]|uniref:hypothetical protein n=1 Tax=unclassified Bacillus cereus group TaxID=2750818 RepID=UPI003F78E51E
MNLQNIEEVNVNITVENGDGSKVTFAEKAFKITDKHVLTVYEDGIQIEEFTNGNNNDGIIIGDTVLDLQGSLDETLVDITQIGNISALDFLLALASIKKDTH